MIKTYRFYKELERWYADIPEWPGTKEELMMVEGADKMLEIIGEGNSELKMNFALTPFENSSELKLLYLGEEEGGGYYLLEKFNKSILNHKLWLCDVTKFVFNDTNMPDKIFIEKVS